MKMRINVTSFVFFIFLYLNNLNIGVNGGINVHRTAPGQNVQRVAPVQNVQRSSTNMNKLKRPLQVPIVCDKTEPDLKLIPKEKSLCYKTYNDISNQEIIGKWVDNAQFSFPGEFGYTNDTAECPVFSGYSCRFHEHGPTVARKRYDVLNCDLPEFIPTKFLQLLRNRRILFSGDSTFMQIFVMIACSMYKHVPFDHHVQHHQEYHYLMSGELYFPSTNTTILFQNYHSFIENQTYFNNYHISDFISYGKLYSSKDLLFLNFGHHFHYESIQSEVTERIAKEYHLLKQNNSLHPQSSSSEPILIWAETTSEHFTTNPSNDKVPTGYFVNWQKTSCSCYENIAMTKKQDYRNFIAEKWMKQYQIPILRIWNMTSTAWNQHYGIHFQRKVYDCLHFCEQSGVYYYYRDLLYNILPPLLAASSS